MHSASSDMTTCEWDFLQQIWLILYLMQPTTHNYLTKYKIIKTSAANPLASGPNQFTTQSTLKCRNFTRYDQKIFFRNFEGQMPLCLPSAMPMSSTYCPTLPLVNSCWTVSLYHFCHVMDMCVNSSDELHFWSQDFRHCCKDTEALAMQTADVKHHSL